MANDVTLSDVAEASGVSVAAASRALNGREGVRTEVRARVKLVAHAMGYRPNRAAKNLAGGRTSVIGVLLGTNELRTDIYGASLLRALSAATDAHDEGLMLLSDTGSPNEAVKNLLSDGLIDGVVISVVAVGQMWTEELLDANIPTVLLGAHPRRHDVPVIDVENAHSTSQVVGHMLDTGCERVAALVGKFDRVDMELRLEGYELAHQERGLTFDRGLRFQGDFSRRSGYELTDEVIAAKPDGVFCGNDEMALGLHTGLMERGVRVPEDICLAGFDGTAHLEVAGPNLTTVRQPFTQLAETAVQSLSALIERRNPPISQLVTPEIYWGDTTRPRTSTSQKVGV